MVVKSRLAEGLRPRKAVLSAVARARSPLALCAILTLGAFALPGCDVGNSDSSSGASGAAANAPGTTENDSETDPDGTPKAGARSVLGKAKERAERLVNEDIAEYNKKIEQAADGKYP